MHASLFGLVHRAVLMIVLFAMVPFAEAAPTLLVSNGILIGANNVSVNGALFNVLFEDGTCAALFHGCTEPSDFQFTDLASAQAAAQALLDTVFVDGPAGSFDSQPTLTRGCSDPDVCGAVIPWTPTVPNNQSGDDSFTGAAAANFVDPSNDRIGAVYALTTFDFSGPDAADVVFAVFSPAAPATVPEPPVFALLGLGLWVARVAKRRDWRSFRDDPAVRIG